MPATVMASSAVSVVEHVVVLKIRDDANPSMVDAMISDIWALASIDVVSYLATGVVLRQGSAAASAAGYTHVIHIRFRSKTDLDTYMNHPSHLAIADVALPLCDDVMYFDWVAEVDNPVALAPGSALRLMLKKARDEGAAKEVLLGALAELKASAAAGGRMHLSYGENFSPAMANGYSMGMLAVFPGMEELEGVEGGEVDAFNEKVRPLLESDLVLDFVLQTLPNSGPTHSGS